jgi:predicted TIM-barrel fold metal-dependent hydrolase
MNAPVVDIHCHVFNADDVPVRGFVQRVGFRDSTLGTSLGQLVDMLIQGTAPGYQVERARLDALLIDRGLEATFEMAPVGLPETDPSSALETEVDAAIAEVQGRDPTLLPRVAAGVAASEDGAPTEVVLEGFADWPGAARRAVRWVTLLGKSRLDLTRLLIASHDDAVDLYCPMLVDLGSGLGDEPPTTMRQQVELLEKISRLSMLGRLPGRSRARVHPFVGFDPRRQVKAELAGDLETPLDVVKDAVERYGFVGVKLYPPMGWRPIGNRSGLDLTEEGATHVDNVLATFYAWCQEEHVPLTAHCNDSNYAHPSYRGCARPEGWVEVLDRFPDLHINLGHFGGARRGEKADGWPWTIARAADGRHLYADVGNHHTDDQRLMDEYLAMLARMFDSADTAAMRDRVMFGSDWFMVALHEGHDRFLETYRVAFERRFGSDATAGFMGGNAVHFLGFDDPHNRNAQRLRSRYERFAPQQMPAWLLAE